MFQKAIEKAAKYTLPVVISYRLENGEVRSSIATFIVLNDEGWILTAFHVMEFMLNLQNNLDISNAYKAKVSEIDAEMNVNRTERKKRLRSLVKPSKNSVTNFSPWWSEDNWQVDGFHGNKLADLAVAKISGFDSSYVTEYPVFKNPDANFYPGAVLCKLGFPFHSIEPEYNDETKSFMLPTDAVPIPLFPIEGMFTRTIIKGVESSPVEFVETSTPGLRGQSGGPTFDSDGRIWAMQSETAHYALGFTPNAPGERNKEHQFLNVGVGTHARTIIKYLDDVGVKYSVSED